MLILTWAYYVYGHCGYNPYFGTYERIDFYMCTVIAILAYFRILIIYFFTIIITRNEY